MLDPLPRPDDLNSRERQRLATRDRLFECSISEFRSVGFEAAQVERIVTAAGVARGTFYAHFPTKSDVLRELLLRLDAQAAQRLKPLRARDARLRETMADAVRTMFQVKAEFDDAELFRETVAMYVRSPHSPLEGAYASHILAEIVQLFGDAQGRGELRADLDALLLASVFLTGLFGLLVFDAPEMSPIAQLADLFLSTFLEGAAP